MDMTRRRFLQYGVGAGAALALPWGARIPLATAAKGGKLAKYVQPVPLPGDGIVVATPKTHQPLFLHADGDRTAAAPGPAPNAALGLRRRLRTGGPGGLLRDGGRRRERHPD